MEDDLRFSKNIRQPQIFKKMEDDPNLKKMEDNLIFWKMDAQYICKWKTTSMFWKMKNDLITLICMQIGKVQDSSQFLSGYS